MGKMMRSLKIIIALVLISLFVLNCSSNAANTEVDQKLKTLFDKNEKFQQMAIKKIQTLEKDVATLKKNQTKLGKQIPVIVKQIKVLKKAIDAGGQGMPPGMVAQLDSIVLNLEAMEQELALVKEQGLPVVSDNSSKAAPPILIKGSDQERIYRQYGDPIERYIVDDKNQVWLYDNGVAVFDMNGRIVSIEFK
jgi:urocanate hydratase